MKAQKYIALLSGLWYTVVKVKATARPAQVGRSEQIPVLPNKPDEKRATAKPDRTGSGSNKSEAIQPGRPAENKRYQPNQTSAHSAQRAETAGGKDHEKNNADI